MKVQTKQPLASNLLPRDVQRARLQRRRVRFWSRAGGMYLAVLGIICGVLVVSTRQGGASAQGELADVLDQSKGFKEATARLEPQVKALRVKLESRKTLAEQPDISELVSMIGASFDDDVILRQMTLLGSGIDATNKSGSRGLPAISGAEREPKHFSITLRGVSRTEKGVSRVTDRLRALEVFSEIELQRTGRDAMGQSAVSFEIACALREGSPAAASVVRKESASADNGPSAGGVR